MKTQRRDLRSLLLAAQAVTAIVGDGSGGVGGIWPGLAPLGVRRASKEYITYSLSSLQRQRTHQQTRAGGRVQADRLEFVLELHGENMDILDDLFEAVDIALEAQSAETTTLFLLDDATDLSDYKDDTSGAVVYTVAMNYIAIRKPASA